jgi:hypothetical protein
MVLAYGVSAEDDIQEKLNRARDRVRASWGAAMLRPYMIRGRYRAR